MPGLLRGIARTAIVAGTATAVSNRVSRRQAGRWAQQDQMSTVDNQSPDKLSQLRELADLRSQGVLTDAEFAEQKRSILNQ
jgi:hypothetical protein